MSTRIIPLLAALLLIYAPTAGAETCQSVGSFDWPSIEEGVWQGCTPSADDSFLIRAGSVVSVTGDIVQSATATDARIRVVAGGALVVEAAETPVVLRLGDSGLRCELGSSCRLIGRYRPFGIQGAKSQPEQSTDWFLRAGLLVPCPGRDASGVVRPDCNGELMEPGSPSRLRFVWPDGLSALDGLDDSFAQIAANGPGEGSDEVWCFFDPDPADSFVPADVNYCYRIVGVGADPPSIDIDVRQTGEWERDTDFPLARRQIVETTLAESATAGDRTIHVDGAVLPSNQVGRFQGYWLYVQDPSASCIGEIDCVAGSPVRILEAEDGGLGSPDRLRIGALSGIRSDLPAGARIWIMPGGWRTGDPVSIQVPVVVRSATEAMEDSRITFLGATELRSVVFDSTANVVFEGPGIDPLVVQDIWAVDIGSSAPTSHSVAVNQAGSVEATFEHLTITGGRGRQAVADRLHAFRVGNADGAKIVLRDLAVRHHGDDCVVIQGDGIEAVVERARCQYASRVGQSMSFLDFVDTTAVNVNARDLECVDCTSPVEPALNFAAGGAYTIDGLLLWGGRGHLGASGAHITDLQVVGSELWRPLSGAAAIDRFVLRDIRSRGGYRIFGSNAVLHDGILRDIEFDGRAAFDLSGVADLDNLAIIDMTVDRGLHSSYGVFRLLGDPFLRLSRIVIAWTPQLAHGEGAADIPNYGLESQAEGLAEVLVDGFLTVGHRPPSGHAWQMPAARMAEMTVLAGPCFHDNGSDVPAALLGQLPPTTIQGVEPPFVDLAGGRVDMLPTEQAISHCGTRFGVDSPGIGRYRWFHAVSGLAPERLAFDSDGDGVIIDPLRPRCAGGATLGCSDNCPAVFNPDQADGNGDGFGDLCSAQSSCGIGFELVLMAAGLRLRRSRSRPRQKV